MLICLVASAAILGPAHAEKVLLASFDGETPQADRNDFGSRDPVQVSGFRLTAPGHGCPTNPAGRALDAGSTPETKRGRIAFALPNDADLHQGTMEFWFRPAWGSGERAIHGLFTVKLRGGEWNSIGLVYHGTIGPTSEAFGANVMDGLDHPAYCDAKTLAWQPGQWHHLAFTWTDHTEYVFVDARLVATVTVEQPFRIRNNEGLLCLGCPLAGDDPTAGGLVDEVRFSDVPLYSPDSPPDPKRRPTGELGLGLATLASGAKATADSTAPPHGLRLDVPALHDGQYGVAVPVGESGKGMVVVHLPAEAEVTAAEWSRDGVPYAGKNGRGWASGLPWPRDFVIEVSRDGESWQPVFQATDLDVSPEFVGTHEALRFRHDFPAHRCRDVRMRILKGPRGDPMMVLDEFAVYGPDGHNLATGACIETELSARTREYAPALVLDGRWGEESCWQSATPGRGVLTVELPAAALLSQVVFSRSHEGLAQTGVASAGRVELSADGTNWQKVGDLAGADPKPRTVAFPAQSARWVRLVITATADGKEPIVDDLRIY